MSRTNQCTSIPLLLILACASASSQAITSYSAIAPFNTSDPCTLWSRTGVPIQGVKNVTIRGDDVDFCSFYRIPYAKPPLKKNRFQKAQMLRLFNEKSRPSQYKQLPPECTQDSDEGLIGTEDCLFVNVFTRKGTADSRRNETRLRPVVVWIHGGTFALGSGLSDGFNPSAFIEQDIVVVSFNYRLDLFGFFPVAADEPYSPNLGLDDQKVVLRWVRKHIKIFGGDPNRVTILGWSAGSASVNYLMYDEEVKGLFQAAIAMSGSFLSPWANKNDPLQHRQQICDTYRYFVRECTLNGILAGLGRNFNDLGRQSNMFFHGVFTNIWGTMFPVFGPATQHPGVWPEQRMRQGPLNDVPLLIGITNNEAKNFRLGGMLDILPQSPFIFPNSNATVLEEVVSMLRTIEARSEDEFKEHLEMSDLYYGVYKFVELHKLRTKKNMHFYRFNWNPEDGTTTGAAHGYDIKLLFRDYDETVEKNAAVGRAMERTWTNFIKFRNPMGKVGNPPRNLHWSNETDHVLEIKSHADESQLADLSTPLFQLWDTIYNCLNNYICDKPLWNGNGTLEARTTTTSDSHEDYLPTTV